MGLRLSKIYTRTGDAGQTGLGSGERVPKNALRITALGDVDELNAHIGMLLTCPLSDDVATTLVQIQHRLFDLGGELCIPGFALIQEEHVKWLETTIDTHNSTLQPLQEFILPGGSPAAAWAHIARTVCRRAERSVVALARTEAVNAPPLQYLNRLSDLLFVLARVLNRDAGQKDVLWQKAQ